MRRPPSIVVVTMRFPVPAEAFAGVEVRCLAQEGARISVHTLRPPHRLNFKLVEDWGLNGIHITHGTLAAHFSGVRFAVLHPVVCTEAVLWLFSRGWRSPGTLLRGLLLLPRCLGILEDIQKRQPDVVHHFWGHYPAMVGRLVQRWLPHIHVSTSLGAYDLLLRYEPGLEVARLADSVWTQAGCNVAALVSCGIRMNRVTVQVRGVDLSAGGGIPPAKSKHAPVACVARLEENKGVDDVLRAVAHVYPHFPWLRLDILGEGPQRRALVRMAKRLGIADAVRFHGAVPHAQVFEALSTAGTFLLLSRNPSERIPNAAKEAMLCRCVCILTDSPGIEVLAAAWKRPRIVAQGDWQAAARHLSEVLEKQDLLDVERDEARTFVLEQLDARACARAKLEVWEPRETSECVE